MIMALVQWGNTHMADERGVPLLHIHKTCGHRMAPVTVCSHCKEEVSARDVRVEIAPAWEGTIDGLIPVRGNSVPST